MMAGVKRKLASAVVLCCVLGALFGCEDAKYLMGSTVLEVTYSEDGGVELLALENITMDKVVMNDGNCEMFDRYKKMFPASLKTGDKMYLGTNCRNWVKMTVHANDGYMYHYRR